MRPVLAAGLLGALLLWSACAKKPIHVAPGVDEIAVANHFSALVREGCYLCLRDVIRQYDALPPRTRQSPVLRPVAARAGLLFLLRTKELGIPQGDEWSPAEAVVEADAGTSPAALRRLRIVWALPWNALGVGEDFVDAERHRYPSPKELAAWREALAAEWPESELGAYLYLSVNCEFRPNASIDLAPVAARYPASPLVQYRWASCSKSGESRLRALLQADPRFQEIHYFLAAHDFGARHYPDAEHEYFLAWQGIPRFTAAGVSAAALALTGEEYDRTIATADAVVAIVPGHRRALLNKVTALSYLGRYQDAAAVAREVIALGHWYLGEAYYWLSWNEYHLEQIPQALADVQTAKRYESNPSIYTLAGLVRMKQEKWPEATQEFLSALAMDDTLCDVHFYLGATEGSLSTWKDAAETFARASGCYASAEQALQQQMATRSRQPPDSWTDRELARARRDLAEATRKKQSSIYNTAVSFLSAGLPDQARTFATQAEAFPSYTDRARVLLARIRPQGPKAKAKG